MRPISIRVLARDRAYELPSANCRGRGAWWDQQEAAWIRATTAAAAAEATKDARAVCLGCPARPECAAWADIDHYTGVAGGGVYIDGERVPADTVTRTRVDPSTKQAS